MLVVIILGEGDLYDFEDDARGDFIRTASDRWSGSNVRELKMCM